MTTNKQSQTLYIINQNHGSVTFTLNGHKTTCTLKNYLDFHLECRLKTFRSENILRISALGQALKWVKLKLLYVLHNS